MKIDVDKLARLAKLRIPPEEKERMERELTAFLEMASVLPPADSVVVGLGEQSIESRRVALDTPLAKSPLPAADTPAMPATPLREDVVRPSLPAAAILQNAPHAANGFLLVTAAEGPEQSLVAE